MHLPDATMLLRWWRATSASAATTATTTVWMWQEEAIGAVRRLESALRRPVRCRNGGMPQEARGKNTTKINICLRESLLVNFGIITVVLQVVVPQLNTEQDKPCPQAEWKTILEQVSCFRFLYSVLSPSCWWQAVHTVLFNVKTEELA